MSNTEMSRQTTTTYEVSHGFDEGAVLPLPQGG